jgi:hypothetical protein
MRGDAEARAARPRIVIVGGGAAGTLVALHLIRTAGRRSTGCDIVLLDPVDLLGRGVAFGTTDERHLLNVPASGMSALPEDPGHFVAWRGRQDPDRIFAVGKYQIIPSTMDRAVEVLGLDRSQRFTPELQDRIFSEFLIVGKRPAIHDYIVGTPGASLEAAQRGLAMEWASFGHPDKGGRSYYGGANHASITLDQSAQALEQMRAGYRERIERGVAPTEAWKQVTASDAAAVDRNGRGVVAAAMADGVLRMGERGDEVRSLQRALNQAGHTDDRGRRLAEDGVFGSSTRESVESLQRAMELKVDGVAGSRTLGSLRAAVPSAASPQPGGAGGRSPRLCRCTHDDAR